MNYRSATLGRRVGERYTNHQQHGLPYSSVTLGRPGRQGRPRENNLFCDLDSREEGERRGREEERRGRDEETRGREGERFRSRSLKRTESFV